MYHLETVTQVYVSLSLLLKNYLLGSMLAYLFFFLKNYVLVRAPVYCWFSAHMPTSARLAWC